MSFKPLQRRAFLRTAAVGGTALLAGCGGNGDEETPTPVPTEAPDDGGGNGGADDPSPLDEEPDYGGYLEGANLYENTLDYRGSDAVTVSVGAGDGFAFDPPAIAVSAGTEVTWEWVGQGGQHNVISDDLGFESELTDEEGFTFSYTFEEAGTYTYYCDPHESVGMKGGVLVE